MRRPLSTSLLCTFVALGCGSCGSGSGDGATVDDSGTTDTASPGADTGAPKTDTSTPGGDTGKPAADTRATDAVDETPPFAFGGLFEKPEPWTKDVSAATKDARSDAITAALVSLGGWGAGSLRIDFSIPLFFADGSTPRQSITAPSGGYCYGGPDCDPVPLSMPLPAGGNTEGSATYVCDTSANDCHVLVVEKSEKKLYELYNSTQAGAAFTALGAFVWDLTKAYPDNERGDQCTSADAAGFPIAALLPTADEVAAGKVDHALRFILPNARMKSKVYVHPASHAGGPSSANPDAPPYGVRFRLKAGFDETGYGAGEKVLLHAMKKYGMLLSDGGNIALTFADDRTSTAKWATLGVTDRSFSKIAVTDFEVVDLSAEIAVTNDCVRNP
ncbi:MAG: hypothetical protein NVSMB47_05020 [Polyangiales bacterium]